MYSTLNTTSPVLELARFPHDKRETLLPYDAADEHVMAWWKREKPLSQQIWIINDSFGALSCFFLAETASELCHLSDSFLSQQAAINNINHNQLNNQRINYTDCLAPWDKAPDLVIIKVPKNLTLLQHQLARISLLPQGTPVLIAARLKDLPAKAVKLLKQAFGNVVPEQAKRKARIMHAVVSGSQCEAPPIATWEIPEQGFQISNHANVFSRSNLDIGARFLLQNLPQLIKPSTVVDLGCGNGVLSMALAKLYPESDYILVDESYMAVASAKENVAENLPELSDRFVFLCQHSLTNFEPQSVDLVICNPPFHQQQAITDEISWQMFIQSYRTLRKGGKLRIVGNRHLGYHVKLKKIFGGVTTIAANAKFVILESEKRD